MEGNQTLLDLRLCGPIEDNAFRALVEWLGGNFPRALVVVRPDLGLSATGHGFLRRLDRYVESRRMESEWPGTVLTDDLAEIIIFRLCPETIDLLLGAAADLSAWQQPNLPEDLCVLREDMTPAMVSTTHEDFFTLHLSQSELARLFKTSPAFKKRLASLEG